MIPTFRPALGSEELEAVRQVFAGRWLGMGETTQRFEEELRRVLTARHVLAVDRGTSALHLALDALELKDGDEVIVPSLTFVATVQAIRHAGAAPVFCEVRPSDLTMDVADVCRRITPRTRVILPVHYAGFPADMMSLRALAGDQGLSLVDDAAHAFGTSYQGRPIGVWADLTCFSFDAIKNITCGEGGAVVTDDDDLARKLARRRVLGIDRDRWTCRQRENGWFYEVLDRGYRYHMANLNAAIGLAQLAKMKMFRQRKGQIAARYDAAFADGAVVLPLQRCRPEVFPFAYVIRVRAGARDALARHLAAQGVRTMVHFTPNHLQPAFARWRQPLPVTERLYEEILTLPLFVEMTDADVDTVIAAVRSFASSGEPAPGPAAVEAGA